MVSAMARNLLRAGHNVAVYNRTRDKAECTSPMLLASLIHDHLLSALANGQGEMDGSSVAKVAARNAGL